MGNPQVFASHRTEMGEDNCCNCLSKLLNIIFLLMGIVCAIVGGIAAFNSNDDSIFKVLQGLSGLPMAIFIFGVAFVGVALIGLMANSCNKKAKESGECGCCGKFFACIYTIIFGLITLIFLAIAIFAAVLAAAPGAAGLNSGTSVCPGTVSVWTGSGASAPTGMSVPATCYIDMLAYATLTSETLNTGFWANFQNSDLIENTAGTQGCCGYYCGDASSTNNTCVDNTDFQWQSTGDRCSSWYPNCRATIIGFFSNYIIPILVGAWITWFVANLALVANWCMCKSNKEELYKA